MNGGLYTNNNGSDVNGLKAAASSPTEAGSNGGLANNGNGPLHIPAKRLAVDPRSLWPPPTTASTLASGYPQLLDTNGGSPISADSIMAVSAASAASAYPTSHYSSLAASEAVRRGATPTGTPTDTKPGLSFWQNDYHKYSVAAASAATTTQPGGSSSSLAASAAAVSSHSAAAASMAAAAASECNQMTAAAGFAAHQAAAWNYPHHGQYGLASPEQAAAEAARARQMAVDSGFHADYTRLQYPPDGIYTHPPGMFNFRS
jgi:hypothetical protein